MTVQQMLDAKLPRVPIQTKQFKLSLMKELIENGTICFEHNLQADWFYQEQALNLIKRYIQTGTVNPFYTLNGYHSEDGNIKLIEGKAIYFLVQEIFNTKLEGAWLLRSLFQMTFNVNMIDYHHRDEQQNLKYLDPIPCAKELGWL